MKDNIYDQYKKEQRKMQGELNEQKIMLAQRLLSLKHNMQLEGYTVTRIPKTTRIAKRIKKMFFRFIYKIKTYFYC